MFLSENLAYCLYALHQETEEGVAGIELTSFKQPGENLCADGAKARRRRKMFGVSRIAFAILFGIFQINKNDQRVLGTL